MATTHHTGPRLTEKLAWYFHRGPHGAWDRFSADEQEKMLQDDLEAGTSVSLLLFALITAGMVLSVVTLLAVVFLQ